jgi:peptide/nickel transport system ATP-binding protein
MSVSPILEARSLTRYFTVRTGDGGRRRKRLLRAVEDVSLSLRPGRVSAIVGESGSGKSVLARMLARIVTPTSGELWLNGQPIAMGTKRGLDYASEVQLVLQDPFASMNPVHLVRHNLERALLIHGTRRQDLGPRLASAMTRVQLTPPEGFLDRFPHELSGGQLQRVSIARALCAQPKVLLADEPVSMLDVSVRLGVLNLVRSLADDEGMATLYITHDIASARYIADETIVMYAGHVVERSEGVSLIDEPTHPYTRLLIASVPDPADPTSVAAPRGEGELSRHEVADVGCRFAPRCPSAMERCRTEEPPTFTVRPGHESKCWLHRDGAVATPVAASIARKGAPHA